jgi:hypothetical protein
MNIFSLLLKYAAERRQTENQCTLSLASILQYYPAFLLHFVNHFSNLHGIKISDSTLLEVIPHFSISIKNKQPKRPDLLIKYKRKPLLVFEMKIDHNIANHQYLYGKQLKCPLVLLTKHISHNSDRQQLLNITWNDIGKITDAFINANGRLRKSEFLREFILFLRETKMYLPDSIVSRENFQYLFKFIASSPEGKRMTRGLKESIDLLNWIYSFLDLQYESLCTTYLWLRRFKSKNILSETLDDQKNDMEVNDESKHNVTSKSRRIWIRRIIYRCNNQVDCGIDFGWFCDTQDANWSFYTSYYYGDRSKPTAIRRIPKVTEKYIVGSRNYREVYLYDKYFIKTKKTLLKLIPEWEREVIKLADWFSKSKLSIKARRLDKAK